MTLKNCYCHLHLFVCVYTRSLILKNNQFLFNYCHRCIFPNLSAVVLTKSKELLKQRINLFIHLVRFPATEHGHASSFAKPLGPLHKYQHQAILCLQNTRLIFSIFLTAEKKKKRCVGYQSFESKHPTFSLYRPCPGVLGLLLRRSPSRVQVSATFGRSFAFLVST